MPLAVLFEDNHCLAVHKPAGVPTVADDSGDLSLHEEAREYIRVKYQKAGAAFLGVVHRLDRPVSGVVLFARTSKSASRLAEQLRSGAMQKVYVALVEGRMNPPQGTLSDWLLKDESRNHTRRVPAGTARAKECQLEYRELQRVGEHGGHAGTLALRPGWTLLEVEPHTGRSHQIRVQLAAQAAIVGDVRYGSRVPLGQVLCLHAHRLTFQHPVTREPVTVVAPLPDWAEW